MACHSSIAHLVNLSGKPDARNPHVRFDEGDQDHFLVPTLPWPPTASWRLNAAAFPPLRLLPSSSPLPYPKVSSRGALPVRPERHNPASMTTQRMLHARALIARLAYCPACGAN